jgi:hypothetical protein
MQPDPAPCSTAAAGLVHVPIGFQEGARRVIDCPGGYFTGVDLYFTESGSPFGRAMKGVRFYCSRWGPEQG